MDKRKVILVAILLIIFGGVGGVIKLSKENQQLKTEIQVLKEDPNKIAKEETAKVVALVGKLVILPEGEEPVMATVTDKEKLKDQPVFAKAENGDKILIYSIAQKAYIYNPTRNVIVDVVPVNTGDGSITITGTDINNPLKVVLVNGTKTAGLTNTLEQRIKDKKVLGISVTAKSTAKTTDYQKTLVIDLTGKWGGQAIQLAQLVGGEVATQSAEDRPAADLMVIVGSNFK
ncbi:MAG: LytR C-terminal domain-containing protein [Microgenomates group bacterium]